MTLLKKLAFVPFFLITFAILIYQLNPLLNSYDFIFSLSAGTFTSLLLTCAFISASSFLFILFATLASDWKISIPVGAIASAMTFVFIPPALAVILAVAIFVSFLLTNLNLDVALKSYLTFQPSSLLGPPIRHLSGLLIIAFCVVYFLSINQVIAQNSFQIPDSLIDTALKMSPVDLSTAQNSSLTQLPAISPEEIALLKDNPDLLQQYGLDPATLNSLEQPATKASQNLTQSLIKQTIKDQIQNFIKPYINFIPAGLAILIFLTLQSLVSIINLLIYPLLWLTFWILEKSGFTKYEVTQREVKKLVV